jgi:hypothetical protein
MDKKTALWAMVIMVLVVSGSVFLQAASATADNPDWVFIKTITGQGTENQSIDVDAFVPNGYHWGVRGRYTATGRASLTLFYAGSNASDSIIAGGMGTYIRNFEPSRSRDHGQGPLNVTAVNTISYELNFYYDANLDNQTSIPSPTVSSSPTATATPVSSNNSAAVVGIVVLVVGIAVVAAVLLFRKKTVMRGSK